MTRLIQLACLAAFVQSACATVFWPPSYSYSLQCGDVVGFARLTLSGTWPDNCIPRSARAELRNGDILITVEHTTPPDQICLQVLRPYSVTVDIVLPDGVYPVYAALESRSRPAEGPALVGEVEVRCHPFCPADYNEDGGVDGADVGAFFIDWERASPLADVNNDGGIDGQDVEHFFTIWQAGGC